MLKLETSFFGPSLSLFQGNELLTWEILVPGDAGSWLARDPLFGLKLMDLALKTRKSLFPAPDGIPDAPPGLPLVRPIQTCNSD